MNWPLLPHNLMMLAITAAIIWGIAAALLPLLGRRRHVIGLWILVVTGVPVLGALTYVLGPGIGVGALIVGFLVLFCSPTTYILNKLGYDHGQSLTE